MHLVVMLLLRAERRPLLRERLIRERPETLTSKKSKKMRISLFNPRFLQRDLIPKRLALKYMLALFHLLGKKATNEVPLPELLLLTTNLIRVLNRLLNPREDLKTPKLVVTIQLPKLKIMFSLEKPLEKVHKSHLKI